MVVAGRRAPRSYRLGASRAAFGPATDIDPLGIFRIPGGALGGAGVDPEVAGAAELFLPRLCDGDALSRGERYYDIRSALLAWRPLVTACRRLAESANAADHRVAVALDENLFNVVAAMTFSYWERCCDEPNPVDGREAVLESLVALLPQVARLHLDAVFAHDLGDRAAAVDWELLESIGARFPRGWRLRGLREFDNKTRVVNEVRYLADAVRARWPFDAVVFPLYGALALAAYFTALEPMPTVLLRVGLYDRGPTCVHTPDGDLEVGRLLPPPWLARANDVLGGRRALVVDDNAATGRTLRICRDFVRSCDGEPLTRSAETSWELLAERPHGEPCLDGVDLPGLRTNLSYAVQRSLTDLLVRRRYDRYVEEVEQLGSVEFATVLRQNVRTARNGHALTQGQRESVEHEWVHARRHWHEPGYPPPTTAVGLSSPDGFPDCVRPWALRRQATAAGIEPLVGAAGDVRSVRIPVSMPGELRVRLRRWSIVATVTPVDVRKGGVDVLVHMPCTSGRHDLVAQVTTGGEVAERRGPVHVVSPEPLHRRLRVVGHDGDDAAVRRTGAVVDQSVPPPGPLLIGEGALDAATGILVRTALDAGSTVLVLAQRPSAAGAFPVPARLEPLPAGAGAAVCFTTDHDALASLPRHRVLGFEVAAMVPGSVLTRLGYGPWADEVAVGALATDGSVRGTVVGAQAVGAGRLLVCQLLLAGPAAAGNAGALAVLKDLLRWADDRRHRLVREDVVLADGRSMTFYPFPRAAL